jgi:uncharacterized protein involved in exopolysaccharide biosynthesis
MAWRKPNNLREWLQIVFRHKKKVFFPAVLVATLVMIASHQVPRSYQASARFTRESDIAMKQDEFMERNVDTLRRMLAENIKGRKAVESVIDDLQLTQGMLKTADGELTAQGRQAKEDLIRNMQRRISVRFAVQTDQLDYVTVSYTDVKRDLVPRVVNQIVENYIRDVRQTLDENLVNAKAFFDREVARLRSRVADLEKRKLQFEMGNPGLNPNEPSSVSNRLNELRRQYRETSQALDVAKGERDALLLWIREQPELLQQQNKEPNPTYVEQRASRAELLKALDNHLHQWGRTEEHPEVIKVRKRIAEIEAQMAQTPQEVDGRINLQRNEQRVTAERNVQELSGRIAGLEKNVVSLEQRIQQLEQMDRNFFAARNEFITINRELGDARNQLSFWESNLRQAMINLAKEKGSRGVTHRIVERAQDLARPSDPTIIKIVGIAVAAGLAVGLGLVLLSELLDHSFRTVEQAVDELKLPVLGAVNEITTPQQAFRTKILSWGVYPPLSVLIVTILLISYYLAYKSLDDPQGFERMINHPGQYFRETLLG